MAKSVENRVVQMQFDNAGFERKINTTLQSLDKLQKGLDMSSAQKNLGDLGKVTKNFNMGNMGSAIEGVSRKFLALSSIGITVLSNLTNRAVDAGINLVKSLSLDQVISGFQEYETNMKSIQTILANTKADNTTLEDVNGALDELNSYADLTIYNFAEMARNIGTFTAAGVDLDTSVASIKGIANAAAISGSTSQQASTAMYQLSQAIASGSLKLMDWNSVVNAGMGGEVMQQALFETGKAMGTLVDVPIDQTFDEWKDAGNTFRESLQEGWITTDVLTTALKGFSGEATEAELAAKGFTESQIEDFRELGETGVEAATKVRTFTQLMDTAQEAVGSGWSQTFRIVLGDFEEATELFTGISEAFGGFADASADARNGMLQDWKDLGGRTKLIEGLKYAFEGIGRVLTAVKDAFRGVFPAITAERLYDITLAFRNFTKSILPTQKTITTIKIIFRGLFNAVAIGIEIIRQVAGVFRNAFSTIASSQGSRVVDFITRFANKITVLKAELVDGGGIASFFERINEFVTRLLTDPLALIDEFREKITGLFSSGSGGGGGESSFGFIDRIKDRFTLLGNIIDTVTGAFRRFGEFIGGIFGGLDLPVGEFVDSIKEELGNIWEAIKGVFSGNDLNEVLDLINTGLFGGLVIAFQRFASNGIFGSSFGNLFGDVGETLEEVTGVLRAMQTDIKSNALVKIAGALALLTASLVVLSLIDSIALTKALTATAVGFAQLAGTLVLMEKATSTAGAAKLGALGVGLVLLAGALLLLSISVKILSTMSWEEMAKGLLSVTILLGALAAAVKVMSANSSGMFRVGLSLIAIAIALNLLAAAMKIFATMSWEDMAKGLSGVGGGLAAIAIAMNLMPKGMMAKSAGLIAVGLALNLIAAAAKIFATMSWEDIGKGLASMAGSLLIIAGAMALMPGPSMLLTAAGLVAVGFALNLIATAMNLFSNMGWEQLARGLAGMAGALVVLAIAAYAMSGSLLGAAAIAVLAYSLGAMAAVIKEFAGLGFGEVAKGLLLLSITLGVLAGVSMLLSPAVGPMLAFGVAMLALGAAMALFGFGANLAAKAFLTVANAGEGAIKVLFNILDELIARIPDVAKSLAEGVLEFGKVFVDAAPEIIEGVKEIIAEFLVAIIELTPQIVEAGITMILGFLEGIRAIFPDLVQTGIEMLMSLLQGIRDNIQDIVTVAAEIIVEFLTGIADNLDDIISAGADVIIEFLGGIADNIADVIAAGADVIVEFIGGMADAYVDIIAAGADALIAFLEGIASNVLRVIDAGFQIVIDFLNGLADSIETHRGELAQAGLNILDAIFGGILEKALEVAAWFGALAGEVFGWIGDVVGTLVGKGVDFIQGIIDGIDQKIGEVTSFFTDLAGDVISWVGNTLLTLLRKGIDLIQGFWNGAKAVWTNVTGWLGGLAASALEWLGNTLYWLYQAGRDVILGFWNGLKAKAVDVLEWLGNFALEAVKRVVDPLGILSPSRVFMEIGNNIMEGMSIGLSKEGKNVLNTAERFTNRFVGAMHVDEKELTAPIGNAVANMSKALGNIDEFNSPVITPVLDLRYVNRDAQALRDIFGVTSYGYADGIASTELAPAIGGGNTQTEVKFEQTINAPKQLSTSDIYRQTKNQIVLAKEELNIK